MNFYILDSKKQPVARFTELTEAEAAITSLIETELTKPSDKQEHYHIACCEVELFPDFNPEGV